MTLYCVKCDYKIESKTRDKICPKCGLPMFVYDEYLEDLKTAKEAEMEAEKEASIDEVVTGEETTTSTPIAEEAIKAAEVSKEEETKETGTSKPEPAAKALSDYEEIISEGDEDEPMDTVAEPAKKEKLPTEKVTDIKADGNDEAVMDWKEAMDWEEMDTSKGDMDNGTETETAEVDEEAKLLLKKGNKKKCAVAAAGIAILVAGVIATIKLLNKKND